MQATYALLKIQAELYQEEESILDWNKSNQKATSLSLGLQKFDSLNRIRKPTLIWHIFNIILEEETNQQC